MFTHARHAVLSCAFACALGGAFPPVAAAEWRRLDTPNFIVVGDASARDLGGIAAQFESFRETLSRILSARATATAVPTVVIVFPNARAFEPFQHVYQGKPVVSAGTFHGDRDFNYITILNDGRPGGMRVIFHEYAHLVISNISMNLPAWLSEGLAEYYSTFELSREGREVSIGRPIENHLHVLARLRALPLDQLLRVDHTSSLYNEGDRRSVFYAQSWALTHMLLLGEPSRTRELADFVRRLNDGAPDVEAWQRAFDDVAVQRDLERYLRRQVFKTHRYRFDEKLAAPDATAAAMPDADVQAMLAALYLRQDRYDEAHRLAGEVVRTSPGHALAHAVLARVEIERGDFAASARRLGSLGAIDDWFVSYTAGVTLADLVARSGDHATTHSRAARAHFDAVQRQRDVPNVFAHLAMLELSSPAGEPSKAQAHIARARAHAPGRDDYALIDARVLAELGQFETARRIFEGLMGPGFPRHVRETARGWLGNVTRMEASWRTGIPRTTAGFRARLSGEERIEGMLEGITCYAAAASFHLRTGTGTETMVATDLSAVQFITYRRDLRGRMLCGPLKEPLPVYLTWKTAGDPATRLVVAIEFLPQKQQP
jgi:tetratricopeptide (TPR) repeat protein